MKLTKQRLNEIIKEELQKALLAEELDRGVDPKKVPAKFNPGSGWVGIKFIDLPMGDYSEKIDGKRNPHRISAGPGSYIFKFKGHDGDDYAASNISKPHNMRCMCAPPQLHQPVILTIEDGDEKGLDGLVDKSLPMLFWKKGAPVPQPERGGRRPRRPPEGIPEPVPGS